MKISRAIPCILAGCLFASFALAQTGPVPASSLPGGAVVTDSDPGSGEQWGRAGGRTYGYSGFALANFTLLEWRSISAAMSFDGPVDAPGEVMIASSFGPTSVVYSGSTNVQLTAGLTPVQTRFTVTLAGAAFLPGTTTVDVLTNSAFTVTVLFEAQDPNTTIWGPALDVFDALDTPAPPAEELANTTFQQGFFFNEVEGLSVAEHDANMQGRADEIVGLLDFLTIEEAGHFAQLVAEHQSLTGQLNDLAAALGGDDGSLVLLQSIQLLVAENNQKMMDLLFAVASLPNGDQLNSVREDLTSLIACMWIGFLCPDEVPEGVTNLSLIAADLGQILNDVEWAKEDIEAIQEQLEALVEQLSQGETTTEIDIEVVSSSRLSGPTRVFLVLTKVGGVPTTAGLTATAAPDSGGSAYSLVAVNSASVELAPGVQQLTVDVSGALNSTNTFLITAERIAPDQSLQYGATMTSRRDISD